MLDARLLAAAGLLGPCELFVDVGANHGFLGAYMLRAGLCGRALLTDISASALQRARRTLAEEGLEDRAELLVQDGLQGLRLGPKDGVAACGMGARTILHILQGGLPCRAVLQPNVELARLRVQLASASMRIRDERIASSGGRFYVLLLVEPGREERPYTQREALLGRFWTKDPLAEPYLAWRRAVAKAALEGALQGKDEEKLRRARLEWEALTDL